MPLYICRQKIFSMSNRKLQVVKFLAHHVAVEMEEIFCQLTMVFYSCKIRMQTRRRDQLSFYRFKCGRCCMITVPVKMYFGVCLLKVSHVLSKLSHTVCTSKTTFYFLYQEKLCCISEPGAMDSLSKLQKLRNRII